MKDSFGNELPKEVILPSGASAEAGLKALVVNTFILAVQVAMQNGKTVLYDKKSKSAAIHDEGGISIVRH